jgi:membrane protein DedA with SNARE-associated domain/pimeloyl-ACP methyl ester carboxylesterase
LEKRSFSLFYWLLAVYLFLLIFSWIVQWQYPPYQAPNKFEQSKVIQSGNLNLEISYLSIHSSGSENTLLILPDAYRGSSFLLPLASKLSLNLNVIIPEYPKEDVDGNLVSQSINSRAQWIKILTDSLNIQNIHLSGHGYGGLVASHISESLSAGEIKSLSLIASMGRQETHFLGNYTINRSLYSLLYPVIYSYKYLLPHFGQYYSQPLNEQFLASMMQLDQRGIPNVLRNIDVPVLILHPEDDRYVPVLTAEENYRLMPQSILITEPEDGRSVMENPDLWGSYIDNFISAVNRGEQAGKDRADQNRVAESEELFDSDDIDTVSGWAIFIIISLLILSTLISEDLACIAGGLLVASGMIGFHHALLGCFMGILTADVLIYWMGRWIGTPILYWVPFKWFISEKDIMKAKEMFEYRGAEIIFITRFLPGTRLPTYLAAGILKTKFTTFFIYFFTAIAIWTPLLVGVSALIGQPMLNYIEVYQDYALWIVIIFVLLIYLIIKFGFPLSTVKGRRQFYVKWVRFKEKYTENASD